METKTEQQEQDEVYYSTSARGNLSDDLLMHIISFATPISILKYRILSKQFKHVCENEEYLWKNICKATFRIFHPNITDIYKQLKEKKKTTKDILLTLYYLSVFITSINYWRKPEEGIRKTIDLLCVYIGLILLYSSERSMPTKSMSQLT